MNAWADVDRYISRFKVQFAQLVVLALEGRHYRKPRFTAPCVWTLIERRKGDNEPATRVFMTFDEAKAELEVHVARRIEKQRERERERASERPRRLHVMPFTEARAA